MTADRANGHERMQLLVLPSGHQNSPKDWALLVIGAGEGLPEVTADILLYKLREREESRGETLADVQLCRNGMIIPYPTAFPYGNGMVLHFYQQQESSTTKTVHRVINKRLKTYV